MKILPRIFTAIVLALTLAAMPVLATQQTVSVSITITVVGNLRYTVPTSIPAIVIGQAYTATVLTLSGGTTPYVCAVDSTTPLPAGLTLAASSNDCVLSGTLASFTGTSLSFKINVHDSTP